MAWVVRFFAGDSLHEPLHEVRQLSFQGVSGEVVNGLAVFSEADVHAKCL